jgi:hypothetical protein
MPLGLDRTPALVHVEETSAGYPWFRPQTLG